MKSASSSTNAASSASATAPARARSRSRAVEHGERGRGAPRLACRACSTARGGVAPCRARAHALTALGVAQGALIAGYRRYAHRVYAMDLVGAGLGCLGTLALLDAVSAPTALLVYAALSAGCAVARRIAIVTASYDSVAMRGGADPKVRANFSENARQPRGSGAGYQLPMKFLLRPRLG